MSQYFVKLHDFLGKNLFLTLKSILMSNETEVRVIKKRLEGL